MALGALIKRGLHEIPQLMYGGAFFFTMFGAILWTNHRERKYDIRNKFWKKRYVVVREEDYNPKKQVHNFDRTYPIW